MLNVSFLHLNRLALLLAVIALMIAPAAFAEDAERGDEDAAKPAALAGETEAPEIAATAMTPATDPVTETYPRGWMIIQGRAGGGGMSGGGAFTFDDVPRGEDDETQFSSQIGHVYTGAIEFLFFPTSGRGFFLSASADSQAGQMVMEFEDDEYGNTIGLDNRVLDYQMGHILGGLGYRWLRGDQLQHGITLHSKLGIGGAGTAVDGFAASQGVSALFEFGTGYHRRFANQMLIGVQFDLRFYGAAYGDFDVDALDTKGSLGLGGGASYFSFVVGWETL